MKFGYDKEKLNELINNYKTTDNKIIITFLDGSVEERPLTKVDEELIIYEMLRQAKFRSESNIRLDIIEKRKVFITNILSMITTTFLNITVVYSNTTDLLKFISSILAGISGLNIVFNGIRYYLLNEKLYELEKYDIYLSMYEDLERYKDKFDVYKGVDNVEDLNINTIDDYTLGAVRKIKDNFDEYEKSTGKVKKNYIII